MRIDRIDIESYSIWRKILQTIVLGCLDFGMLSLTRDILVEFLQGSTKKYKYILKQASTYEKITMNFVSKHLVKNKQEIRCFKRYYWFYRTALVLIPVKIVLTFILAVCGYNRISVKISIVFCLLIMFVGCLEVDSQRRSPHRDRHYREK